MHLQEDSGTNNSQEELLQTTITLQKEEACVSEI
jgi:hypothetical protein